MAVTAMCIAPVSSIGVASYSSSSSTVLRASGRNCCFASLRLEASSSEKAVSHAFSSCSLRSSRIQELSRFRRYSLVSGERDQRGFFLTVAAVANPVDVNKGFDEMIAGTTRKYYMLGGKGGVGKTSLAASLAVKFANSGHPTLVVSTDPAHSLSDSFAQDLSGGTIMPVDGVDLPLYAMEINPEQAREEFRTSVSKDGGTGVKDFMDSLGLGGWVDELSELKLGELLDTPPPGLDEAIAISKVVQFMQAPEYSKFTRIIFDTAPTVLLTLLPSFERLSLTELACIDERDKSIYSSLPFVLTGTYITFIVIAGFSGCFNW